ncbi:MAG: ParB N-terminal domain-containing protein [Gemmatimonadaceae bacterium]|nr:ParB N-terminal domain-containing protein [Gemmatimonadaceae bacterium]MCW5825239.1 ParB N-terminal domain-containing protein [Gemmatimonadaceae bacterium]
MATAKKKRPAKKSKKAAAAQTRGLDARRLASASPPAAVAALGERIEQDGGQVLAAYRDPLGGRWQILAALPIGRVEPTPYQRDLSDTHVARLGDAIDKLDRFLDPLVTVPAPDGGYWTPNGNHRLGAMRQLGAKAITALVVPEENVAHRILALNTEKAHNLRERALEVSRLAEALAAVDDAPEKSFAEVFEEAPLVTLGLCYQANGRFSGGAYHPILKRCDQFLGSKLPAALVERRRRAEKLLELNGYVNEAVAALKARGLESPYLKAFVVARINHLRFVKDKHPDFDSTIDKILGAARRFNASNVKADQVARSGGPPASEE